MNFTIAIGILTVIFLYGCFLYVRRKRIERLKPSDLDIPAFLRRENVGNDITCDAKFNPDVRIHPWGKTR